MSKTQILAARAGEITPEMEFCAQREELPVETIRDEVAAGRMVIPANKVHAAGALRADVHRHRGEVQDQREHWQQRRHQQRR